MMLTIKFCCQTEVLQVSFQRNDDNFPIMVWQFEPKYVGNNLNEQWNYDEWRNENYEWLLFLFAFYKVDRSCA